MRKGTCLATLAMTVGTLLGSSQPSIAEVCVDHMVYAYCGYHLRRGQVLRFRLNVGSRPAGVKVDALRHAARTAAFEWDRHWPVAGDPTPVNNTYRPGDCQWASARAICVEGTTSAGVDTSDGINTIVFANPGPAQCPGGAGIGSACIRSSPGPGGTRRILEVDIVLRPPPPDASWTTVACPYSASPPPSSTDCARTALGQTPLPDSVAGVPVQGAEWLDVQTVITHEMGHALGLEHHGSPSSWWPLELEDALRFSQTMYRWTYRNTTFAQTIDYGDVLGLQRAALDAWNDPSATLPPAGGGNPEHPKRRETQAPPHPYGLMDHRESR